MNHLVDRYDFLPGAWGYLTDFSLDASFVAHQTLPC